jgi:hypothetical protein
MVVKEIWRRYRSRYLPGQALSRAESRPQSSAHIVVDNDDPESPRILEWAPPAASLRDTTWH